MGKEKGTADPTNFSSATVQILRVSHEVSEFCPCALLTVGDVKVVFNCGAGFQRCCSETQVKVSRIRGIFLTRVNFNTCSGVPGAVLQCAEAAHVSLRSLDVAGPPRLGLFMNALAAYSDYSLNELNLNVKELKAEPGGQPTRAHHVLMGEPVLDLPTLKVYGIILLPEMSVNAPDDADKDKAVKKPRLDSEADAPGRVLCPPSEPGQPAEPGTASPPVSLAPRPGPDSGRLVSNTPDNDPPVDIAGAACAGQESASDVGAGKRRRSGDGPGHAAPSAPDDGKRSADSGVLLYVCAISDKRGKFLPDKARALGVPRGPDYGRLAKGNSVVVAATGATVTPEQCLEAGTPGERVLVVDCPDPAYLPALHSATPELIRLLSRSADVNRTTVVVHLTPWSVACSGGYQAWLRGLGEGVVHLQCSKPFDPSWDSPSVPSAHKLQAKLHLLCSSLFSLPAALHGNDDQPSAHGTPVQAQSTTCSPTAKAGSGPSIAQEQPDAGTGTATKESDAVDLQSTATGARGAPTGTSPASNRVAMQTGVDGARVYEMRNMGRFVLRPLTQQGLDESETVAPLTLEEIQNELLKSFPAALKQAAEAQQRMSAAADEHASATQMGGDRSTQSGEAATQGRCAAEGAAAPDATAPENPALEGRGGEGEDGHAGCGKRDGFRLIVLGTGAACPSKYRNVTAIYLDFGDRGSVLVDCGEGTLGQLERHFGAVGARECLRKLQCVWLSHRHADHHVGLSAVLAYRAQLLGGVSAPKLPVFGPFPLRRVLSACNRIEPMAYEWVDQYSICPREQGAGKDLDWFWERLPNGQSQTLVNNLCEGLGLKSFASVLVEHCKHSFGLLLESQAGWKFVFSGDTRRCENLVEAATGATVLVHEATFENDKADEAAHKKHSTIGDALEVAKRAGCKSLILTHFSQRYPKVPKLEDVAAEMTGVAFDLMTVGLDTLHLPAALLPVLSSVFGEEL